MFNTWMLPVLFIYFCNISLNHGGNFDSGFSAYSCYVIQQRLIELNNFKNRKQRSTRLIFTSLITRWFEFRLTNEIGQL